MPRTCENDHRLDRETLRPRPCTERATTKRKTWWFGDESKGEPLIVHGFYYLCAECAESWDENRAEAEAEAAAS